MSIGNERIWASLMSDPKMDDYLRRWKEVPILVTCLSLNEDVAILHLPAEAFIEYQLFARDLRPDAFVAVAAYGDLGPVYITLERSFEEGGYEPTDAYVSGRSEAIMKSAIEKVLNPDSPQYAGDYASSA